MTVENLTNGAFKKSLLMYTVSLGVGCGITLGVVKIIFDIPLGHLLIPGYALAAVLTFLSSEEFVNVAWDSAGVTTGPVTVPLVLSLGIGIANSAGKGGDSLSGFGIVTLASLFPIIAVMILALYVSTQYTPEMIIEAATAVQSGVQSVQWHEEVNAWLHRYLD